MFITFTIRAIVAFITIIDPVGLAPVVIALTAHMSKAQRNVIVTRATIISALIIAFFGIVGRFILGSLGINLYAFNIAGGVLLFLVGFDMLFGRSSGVRETKAEAEEARTREDVSVFPLAIPMIAGPGTITTVILLVGNAVPNATSLSAIAVAALITLAACWIAMRLSALIQARIGTTGILVLSRVLGMLLAAIAVQFILNGITIFMAGLAATH